MQRPSLTDSIVLANFQNSKSTLYVVILHAEIFLYNIVVLIYCALWYASGNDLS